MSEQSVLTARGTVYPWQCDHMGHMNVMWYVGKFDEGTWHSRQERARPALRNVMSASYLDALTGFRLALIPTRDWWSRP